MSAGVGVAIAAVDSFAAGGEVSPIVIVALLFVATALIGAFVRVGSFGSIVAVWAWLPLAHVFKHALHLPDTLHPNSYRSILYLGLFTFAVSVAGMMAGVLFVRTGRYTDPNPRQ
jgi:hypothetical protein